jgi:hypothetical protein
VLFGAQFIEGIQEGTINVTFRRWKRRQVIAGNRYRTTAGRIIVDKVEIVGVDDITESDARAAGFEGRLELLAALPDPTGRELYRIRFHPAGGTDERAELAVSAELDPSDVAEIARRLDRLDRSSTHRPWTRAVLHMIADQPATRAGDLAEQFGRERLPFKTDVRKLKNLGLTYSLDIGYELSPRGIAFLAAEQADAR